MSFYFFLGIIERNEISSCAEGQHVSHTRKDEKKGGAMELNSPVEKLVYHATLIHAIQHVLHNEINDAVRDHPSSKRSLRECIYLSESCVTGLWCSTHLLATEPEEKIDTKLLRGILSEALLLVFILERIKDSTHADNKEKTILDRDVILDTIYRSAIEIAKVSWGLLIVEL